MPDVWIVVVSRALQVSLSLFPIISGPALVAMASAVSSGVGGLLSEEFPLESMCVCTLCDVVVISSIKRIGEEGDQKSFLRTGLITRDLFKAVC